MKPSFTVALAAALALLSVPAIAQVSADVVQATVQGNGQNCPTGYSASPATGGMVCAKCSRGTLTTHAVNRNPVCIYCKRGTPGFNPATRGYVCNGT
jgi:hypothetical protein